jgi:hypothetical protein
MTTQKAQTSIAFAAAVLLAGVSMASAADNSAAGMQSPGANVQSPGVKMSMSPSDSLNLTKKQQKTAWNDLYVKRLNQRTPAGFNATAGAVLPTSVTIAPVTDAAAGDVPTLKPYNFAMLQKKLLIVNPTDRKIAEVITR